MRRLFLILTALSLSSWSANAYAICGAAPCKMVAALTSVEPESACVEVRVVADECDCALDVELTNHCASSVTVGEEEFDRCWVDEAWVGACASLGSGDVGTFVRYLVDTNAVTEAVSFIDANGEHEVTATAKVSEFYDTGCGACWLAVPRVRSNGASFVGVIAVLLILWTRRARPYVTAPHRQNS